MKKFDKISERTIEAVVGGADVELGPGAMVRTDGTENTILLFIDGKVYPYTNDASVVNYVNRRIVRHFEEKDAYMLDLPTRIEVYDDPEEYEDAKNKMAMRYVYNVLAERDLFEDAEWNEECAEVTVRLSMFKNVESMRIRYNSYEDAITLTDYYGNEIVVDYNVEDEDYFQFQEVFFDGYEELMAMTVKYIINNI